MWEVLVEAHGPPVQRFRRTDIRIIQRLHSITATVSIELRCRRPAQLPRSQKLRSVAPLPKSLSVLSMSASGPIAPLARFSYVWFAAIATSLELAANYLASIKLAAIWIW